MFRIPPKPLRSNLFGLDDAAAAALVSGVIAGGVSWYNNHEQRKEQRSLMDKSIQANIQQWNRETQYNTPQAQMKRFKDAGLNPNLIYGQSNTASSMTPSSDVPEAKMPHNSVSEGIQSMMQMHEIQNQDKLTDSQVELNEANADKARSESGMHESQSNYLDWLSRKIETADIPFTQKQREALGVQMKKWEQETKLFVAETAKAWQEGRMIYHKANISFYDYLTYHTRLDAQLDNLASMTDLNRAQERMCNRQIFEMIESFNDRLESLKKSNRLLDENIKLVSRESETFWKDIWENSYYGQLLFDENQSDYDEPYSSRLRDTERNVSRFVPKTHAMHRFNNARRGVNDHDNFSDAIGHVSVREKQRGVEVLGKIVHIGFGAYGGFNYGRSFGQHQSVPYGNGPNPVIGFGR